MVGYVAIMKVLKETEGTSTEGGCGCGTAAEWRVSRHSGGGEVI